MATTVEDVQTTLSGARHIESVHTDETAFVSLCWIDAPPTSYDMLLGLGQFVAIHGDEEEFIKQRVYEAVSSSPGEFEVDIHALGYSSQARGDGYVVAVEVLP